MKKVLFTATVDSHILNFHKPYLEWFKHQGFEVHVASNGNSFIPYTDIKFDIPFERSPFKFRNIKVYRELRRIIEKNNYDLIHCHTPMGNVLTRLAAINARKKGTKVISTAHGFHFFKGAPFKSWLLYYPVEKLLSKYTDCLVTINVEDYKIAKKNFFAGKVGYMYGMGVDLGKFRPFDENTKKEVRLKLGFKISDVLLIYVAELNQNKNQKILISMIPKLKEIIPNVQLLLVGSGQLENEYKSMAKDLNVDSFIHFLGYRNDINDLLPICDIAVASSLREGLPLNVLEAMACGIPIVATNNRGHRELVIDDVNGVLLKENSSEEFLNGIIYIHQNKDKYKQMSKKNLDLVKNYSLKNSLEKMSSIYNDFLK